MKKILTILICIVILCSFPVAVFAEEVETPVEAPTETEVPETETETPETETDEPNTETEVPDTVPETPDTETETPETETPDTETEVPDTDVVPEDPETPDTEVETPEADAPETELPETDTPTTETPETETPTPEVPETETPETNETPNTENPGTDETPTEPSEDTPKVEDDPNDLTVEKIASFVKTNYEEISVIVAIIFAIIDRIRNGKKTTKAVTTLNNNSIAVARNSETAIKDALSVMEKFEERVKEYEKSTAKIISKMTNHLEASKRANVELANEVAELLILANIPNSKKDELYARHLAAVNAIAEVEYIDEDTEVKENESKEE